MGRVGGRFVVPGGVIDATRGWGSGGRRRHAWRRGTAALRHSRWRLRGAGVRCPPPRHPDPPAAPIAAPGFPMAPARIGRPPTAPQEPVWAAARFTARAQRAPRCCPPGPRRAPRAPRRGRGARAARPAAAAATRACRRRPGARAVGAPASPWWAGGRHRERAPAARRAPPSGRASTCCAGASSGACLQAGGDGRAEGEAGGGRYVCRAERRREVGCKPAPPHPGSGYSRFRRRMRFFLHCGAGGSGSGAVSGEHGMRTLARAARRRAGTPPPARAGLAGLAALPRAARRCR
jgi:hypothetical protein